MKICKNETWKPVVGWNGLYEVSSCGRVRSLQRLIVTRNGRLRTVKGGILRLKVREGKYIHVIMSRNDVQTTRLVHQLVLESFVGPRPPGMETRHLDGNKHNNCVQNLCWGTKSENIADQIRHGTHRQASKTSCPRGHLLALPNLVKYHWAVQGNRVCLACDRAGTFLVNRSRRGDDVSQFSLKSVADRYYADLMPEAVSA